MPTPRRSSALKVFWRIHRWIYELTDGRLGSHLFSHDILKLIATGHRSGESRSILIYYYPYGDSFVIIGSNAGHTRHPAWYLNLQADPQGVVQIGRKRIPIRAREAEGEEREQLWSEISDSDPSYLEYQERTERRIPVMILDPAPDP